MSTSTLPRRLLLFESSHHFLTELPVELQVKLCWGLELVSSLHLGMEWGLQKMHNLLNEVDSVSLSGTWPAQEHFTASYERHSLVSSIKMMACGSWNVGLSDGGELTLDVLSPMQEMESVSGAMMEG